MVIYLYPRSGKSRITLSSKPWMSSHDTQTWVESWRLRSRKNACVQTTGAKTLCSSIWNSWGVRWWFHDGRQRCPLPFYQTRSPSHQGCGLFHHPCSLCRLQPFHSEEACSWDHAGKSLCPAIFHKEMGHWHIQCHLSWCRKQSHIKTQHHGTCDCTTSYQMANLSCLFLEAPKEDSPCRQRMSGTYGHHPHAIDFPSKPVTSQWYSVS